MYVVRGLAHRVSFMMPGTYGASVHEEYCGASCAVIMHASRPIHSYSWVWHIDGAAFLILFFMAHG